MTPAKSTTYGVPWEQGIDNEYDASGHPNTWTVMSSPNADPVSSDYTDYQAHCAGTSCTPTSGVAASDGLLQNEAIAGLMTAGTSNSLLYMYGATVWLYDDTSPVVTANQTSAGTPPSGFPTGWVTQASGTVAVTATSPGLGTLSSGLDTPDKTGAGPLTLAGENYDMTTAQAKSPGTTTPCTGDPYNAPCPTSAWTQTYSYNTNTMPDGLDWIYAGATDASGNISTASPAATSSSPTSPVGGTALDYWPVLVDRSSPQESLSGSLYRSIGSTMGGGWADLGVNATDPADTANGVGSGVVKLEFKVDGVDPNPSTDLVTQACPNLGCGMSYDFVVNTSTLSAGVHTFEIDATNQAGTVTVGSFQVTINPSQSLTTESEAVLASLKNSGAIPTSTILPQDLTAAQMNISGALAQSGATSPNQTSAPAGPANATDYNAAQSSSPDYSSSALHAAQTTQSAADLTTSASTEAAEILDGLNPATDGSTAGLSANIVSDSSVGSTVATGGDPPQSAPASGDVPDITTVPVFDYMDWFWDLAGDAPATSITGAPGAIRIANGWYEAYIAGLGWVAAQPNAAATVVPYYAWSSHAVFSSVPVLTGWSDPTSSAADFQGTDDPVTYVAPDGQPADTEATAPVVDADAARVGCPAVGATGCRFYCKVSHANQTYNEYQVGWTFMYREDLDARWCWNNSNHANWDGQYHNVEPTTYNSPLATSQGFYQAESQWNGAIPFSWNGHGEGGTWMAATYVQAYGGPLNSVPASLNPSWTDTLALVGTYSHGHWRRCSIAGQSVYPRAGGGNDNTICGEYEAAAGT